MSKRILWFLNRAQPEVFVLVKRDNRHAHLREKPLRKHVGPAMIESVVRLREAEELGVHPKIAIGRFDGDELVYVMTSDDAGCKNMVA